MFNNGFKFFLSISFNLEWNNSIKNLEILRVSFVSSQNKIMESMNISFNYKENAYCRIQKTN